MRNTGFRALFSALVLLSISATTPALSNDKDIVTAESAKLEGTYAVVGMETNGESAPPKVLEEMKSLRMVIKGNTLTILKAGDNGKDKVQTITVDPAKSPKQIDITREFGTTKKTALGIYSLDGKTLKICADDSGKERPTAFETKKGVHVSIVVLEKQ